MTGKLADSQRARPGGQAGLGRPAAAGWRTRSTTPDRGAHYASFLLQRAQDNPEQRQDLEVVVRETKRCREIVRSSWTSRVRRRRGGSDDLTTSPPGGRRDDDQLHLRHVALKLDLPMTCR